jgi:hypothetical protein
MTATGQPTAIFRRAIDNGNLIVAEATARDSTTHAFWSTPSTNSPPRNLSSMPPPSRAFALYGSLRRLRQQARRQRAVSPRADTCTDAIQIEA